MLKFSNSRVDAGDAAGFVVPIYDGYVGGGLRCNFVRAGDMEMPCRPDGLGVEGLMGVVYSS